MSIFASQTQSDPIPIPFDPPHTITVRKLTGREIERAQQAHAHSLAEGESRTWSARFRRILEGSLSDKKTIQAAIADPLTGFDRYTLVAAGLVAWSYPQWVVLRADPVNKADDLAKRTASLDDLDDEALDFIATEVLRLTKPGLFLTTEEDVETAQKELPAAAPPA